MIYSLKATTKTSTEQVTLYSSEDPSKVATRYNKPLTEDVLVLRFYEGDKLLIKRNANDFIGHEIK